MKDVTLSKIIGRTGVFIDGDWIESKDQDPYGDVRLIQLADIGDGEFLNKSTRFLTSQKSKQLNCTFIEPGDLLIARMPDPLGRACIFPGDDKPCITAVDVCIVRPDPNIASAEWLKFQINNREFRNKINKFITGTTRQRISRSNLDKMKFKLPPLPDQIRIATILSKAEALIAQRKESLRLIDELLKSTFLEMFGDQGTNSKKWKEIRMLDLCSKPGDIKCGPFGTQLKKEEYKSLGIALWGIPQINSAFKVQPSDFVSEEKAMELEQYSIVSGDIAMSRKGNVGKCSLYPKDLPKGIIHSDVLRIRCDKNLINPVYLLFQLKLSPRVENQIAALSKGAVMAGINVAKLKHISIQKSPIALQTQFAQIVEKVEALKAHYQASLKELENLYGSLSQRAFKGELDLSRVASDLYSMQEC